MHLILPACISLRYVAAALLVSGHIKASLFTTALIVDIAAAYSALHDNLSNSIEIIIRVNLDLSITGGRTYK